VNSLGNTDCDLYTHAQSKCTKQVLSVLITQKNKNMKNDYFILKKSNLPAEVVHLRPHSHDHSLTLPSTGVCQFV